MRPATVRGSGVRRDDAAAIVKLVCHCLDSITEDSRKPRPIPCDALASCANAPSLSPRQRRSSEIGADTWEGAFASLEPSVAVAVPAIVRPSWLGAVRNDQHHHAYCIRLPAWKGRGYLPVSDYGRRRLKVCCRQPRTGCFHRGQIEARPDDCSRGRLLWSRAVDAGHHPNIGGS